MHGTIGFSSIKAGTGASNYLRRGLCGLMAGRKLRMNAKVFAEKYPDLIDPETDILERPYPADNDEEEYIF